MAEIITTLHPDGDENTNLYPNIKKENIPSKSISTDKLDNNVLSLIGSLKPSGTDTSTNILAYTTNKGIYVATDNGHWYYWNGSAYTDGGVYQSSEDIKQLKEDLGGLSKEVNEIRYLEKLFSDVKGWKTFDVDLKAGITYTITANCNVGEVIIVNSNGETVQTIADYLNNGMYKNFSVSENQSYIKLYFAEIGNLVITCDEDIVSQIRNETKAQINDIYFADVTLDVIETTNADVLLDENIKYTFKNNGTTIIALYYSYDGITYETISEGIVGGASVDFTPTNRIVKIKAYSGQQSSITISRVSELSKVKSDIESINTGVLNVKSAIVDGIKNEVTLWEQGGFQYNGIKKDTSKEIRMKNFVGDYVSSVYTDIEHKFYVFGWDESNTCVGFWNNETRSFVHDENKSLYECYEFNIENVRLYYPNYNFIIVLINSDHSDITPEAFGHIRFNNYIEKLKDYRRTPMLTFIDDDGFAESARIWEEITDELNIPATMALITDKVGDVGMIDWDTVDRLNNKGIEFISHTHTHIDLAHDDSNTEEQVRDDFKTAINLLKEHGCTPNFVVYPHTICTDRNKTIVRQYFNLGIAIGEKDNKPYIPKENTLRYSLNRVPMVLEDMIVNGKPVKAYPYRTVEEMKQIIDIIVNNRSWAIFMTHLRNTCNNTTGGDGFYYDEGVKEMIKESVKYAISKGVKIVTVEDGYKEHRYSFI